LQLCSVEPVGNEEDRKRAHQIARQIEDSQPMENGEHVSIAVCWRLSSQHAFFMLYSVDERRFTEFPETSILWYIFQKMYLNIDNNLK
jgi:hypothetical protein